MVLLFSSAGEGDAEEFALNFKLSRHFGRRSTFILLLRSASRSPHMLLKIMII